MISFLRYWMPLLIWMILIFSASADTQSTQHTSRFLEPFLRWLNPNISTDSIDKVRWLVRKAAHLTEYALLAWLAWRAVRQPKRHNLRPWSWKPILIAFATVVLYATTDEVHQTFVPNRTGSWKDVCIDTMGGVLGLAAICVWHLVRRRRPSMTTDSSGAKDK
jgi:VanZ family protein